MSLAAALNTAVSGLLAQQQAIAATSENIANVNSPDFARRQVNFFENGAPSQFSGVSVEISRAGADRFLQAASYRASSDAASLNVIAEALARLETSLGAPGDNLSFANKLDDAFAAFAELSAFPSSLAAKTVAANALADAFAAFARTTGAIDGEITAADARLEAQIARVNALLEEIFRLNQSVADGNGAGDVIDGHLQELSSLIDIAVSRADDGRVTVATADGRLLANAGGYAALSLAASGAGAAVSLAPVDPDSGVATGSGGDVAASLTGGEIGGLLSLRNDRLPALRAIVDAAAQNIADEINTVYAGNASAGLSALTTAPLIVASGGGFAVDPAILDDPSTLAIARPAVGGAGGANDGTGAAAIAALGQSAAASGAASALSEIGAAARIAADRSAAADAFASEVEVRRLSDAGVNLDQELSNLVLYQRSYAANARVIAAIDELYQSLLSIL